MILVSHSKKTKKDFWLKIIIMLHTAANSLEPAETGISNENENNDAGFWQSTLTMLVGEGSNAVRDRKFPL